MNKKRIAYCVLVFVVLVLVVIPAMVSASHVSQECVAPFATDLEYRDGGRARRPELGEEVRKLQKVLNYDEDSSNWIAKRGSGSPGRESTYYGIRTIRAVRRFQGRFGIIEPRATRLSLKGRFVSEPTRTKLNELFACSPVYINSIQPQSAGFDAVVKVSGYGFSESNMIRFSNLTDQSAPLFASLLYSFVRPNDDGSLDMQVPRQLFSRASSTYINVAPGTYFVQVSNDRGTSNNFQFTVTGPAGDYMSPIIRGVSVADITQNSAAVQWSTDETTYGHVLWGTTQASLQASNTDGAFSTNHRVSLIGLLPASRYYFSVVARDSNNNTSQSPIFSFITASSTATSSPPVPAATTTAMLSVFRIGTGSGFVRGQGIFCGTDCTENYSIATGTPTVSLSAIPFSATSTFGGWTGCNSVNGEGWCSVIMSTNKIISAQFDAMATTTATTTSSTSLLNSGLASVLDAIQGTLDRIEAVLEILFQ